MYVYIYISKDDRFFSNKFLQPWGHRRKEWLLWLFCTGWEPPWRFMFGEMWRFVGACCADTWPGLPGGFGWTKGEGGVKLDGWVDGQGDVDPTRSLKKHVHFGIWVNVFFQLLLQLENIFGSLPLHNKKTKKHAMNRSKIHFRDPPKRRAPKPSLVAPHLVPCRQRLLGGMEPALKICMVSDFFHPGAGFFNGQGLAVAPENLTPRSKVTWLSLWNPPIQKVYGTYWNLGIFQQSPC